MVSEWEAIVEQFDKKDKARKAVVSQPIKPGEARVTSIRVNGGRSYGPALVNQGCSNGTTPQKGGLLRSWPYGFWNAMECLETEKDF